MHKRSPLPETLQTGPFTANEARTAGISRKRTRSSDLESPFHGVRAEAGSLPTVRERCHAYAVRMPPGQFFSHVTAARIHGIPLPRRLEDDATLHVSVCKPDRAPRADGVLGHTVDMRPPIQLVAGLRILGPVETWCQLAPLVGLDDLIAAGDRLLGLPHPLATAEEVAAAVGAQTGHRGARRLREAHFWVRPRVESPRETRLRLLIVRAGFPEPDTNIYLPLRPGKRAARGDLVFLAYKVLLEYDGEQHRTEDKQYHRDVERRGDVGEEHWRVIRVLKSTTDAWVLERLDAALRDRGWRP